MSKIVEVLNSQPEPAVLVGHSSAGLLIQAAAPKAADKITRMVFINAFLMPDQKAQFDLVPPEVAQGMIAAAEASSDNSVPVDEGFVRGVLMDGDSIREQDELISRLVPQPIAIFTTRIDTKPFAALNIPKTVIFCTRDASLPPGAYMGMASILGEYNLVEVEGGHETLFTHPLRIARTLLNITEGA